MFMNLLTSGKVAAVDTINAQKVLRGGKLRGKLFAVSVYFWLEPLFQCMKPFLACLVVYFPLLFNKDSKIYFFGLKKKY